LIRFKISIENIVFKDKIGGIDFASIQKVYEMR